MGNEQNSGQNESLWLSVRPDSQLARLLGRLVQDPTIRTSEVSASWTQPARKGGVTNLSPTRAAFILDALADATEGAPAKRIDKRKGVMILKGVRQAVKTTAPETAKPLEQVNRTVAMHADEVKVKVDTAPAMGAGPRVEDDARGGEIVFPSTPALPKVMKSFERPDWYDDMELALDNGLHVSLAGPPGIGKSTAPEQYFIRRGQPFVVVNGDGGTRRRDLEGFPEAKAGTTSFQAAEFAAAAVNGWGAILNEVNACEPDALIMLNGILEVPHAVTIHGKTYPVHPNFRLVITYNPGLTGTKPLPQSFKDRFFSIRVGFPTASFLHRLLVANGMPAGAPYADSLIAFALETWALHEKGNVRYQITPRRLFHAVFLLENRRGKIILRNAIERAVLASIDGLSDRQAIQTLVGRY